MRDISYHQVGAPFYEIFLSADPKNIEAICIAKDEQSYKEGSILLRLTEEQDYTVNLTFGIVKIKLGFCALKPLQREFLEVSEYIVVVEYARKDIPKSSIIQKASDNTIEYTKKIEIIIRTICSPIGTIYLDEIPVNSVWVCAAKDKKAYNKGRFFVFNKEDFTVNFSQGSICIDANLTQKMSVQARFALDILDEYWIFVEYYSQTKSFPKSFDSIQESSGNIQDNSQLVSFLYLLMRDYVTSGKVEKILTQIPNNKLPEFSNKCLAEYAKDIALRLLDKKIIKK